MQLEVPVLDWYVFAAQLRQLVAEAIEYLPAVQVPVTVVRPVVAQ